MMHVSLYHSIRALLWRLPTYYFIRAWDCAAARAGYRNLGLQQRGHWKTICVHKRMYTKDYRHTGGVLSVFICSISRLELKTHTDLLHLPVVQSAKMNRKHTKVQRFSGGIKELSRSHRYLQPKYMGTWAEGTFYFPYSTSHFSSLLVSLHDFST